MPKRTPGERIRAARLDRGWTQEQLAVYANLTTKTIWSIENGGPISRKSAQQLAETLGIEIAAYGVPA